VKALASGRAERWLYLGLGLLLIIVAASALATRPLFNPDEGRYAEIPREMLASGDFVIPHIDGLAYIEKPPLQFWATALNFKLFGASALTARLYTALCALGCVILVGFTARSRGEAGAWRAAAVLTSLLLFVLLSQLLTLDMSLTFYLSALLCAFLAAQRAHGAGDARRATLMMLLAWTAVSLGVLTKGIVAAAIPVAVLCLYTLAARDARPWRRLAIRFGLPIFLLIAVPWHYLAARRLDDFMSFYFIHEHLARYLTPEAQRQEAWWFFLAVFVLGSVPWTISAVRAVFSGWRIKSQGEFNEGLFLWIWILFVVVFFSLSDSKLIPYILPAFPALALLVGTSSDQELSREVRITGGLSLIIGIAVAIASLRWAALVPAGLRGTYFLPLKEPLAIVAALTGLAGALVLLQAKRDLTRSVVFLSASWSLSWLVLMRAASAVAPIYSGAALAAGIPPGDAPVYSVGTYDQALPFYLNRRVKLVHFRGELDYGLKRDPGAEIDDLSQFLKEWAGEPQAFAIMEKTMFEQLLKQGAPMRVVVRANERVLVARQ
jgi:4-amino-4-deoxy-L-arabinose transferase-like glycosyltransferase